MTLMNLTCVQCHEYGERVLTKVSSVILKLFQSKLMNKTQNTCLRGQLFLKQLYFLSVSRSKWKVLLSLRYHSVWKLSHILKLYTCKENYAIFFNICMEVRQIELDSTLNVF